MPAHFTCVDGKDYKFDVWHPFDPWPFVEKCTYGINHILPFKLTDPLCWRISLKLKDGSTMIWGPWCDPERKSKVTHWGVFNVGWYEI